MESENSGLSMDDRNEPSITDLAKKSIKDDDF